MLRRSLCVSALILAGTVGFASSAKAQTADVLFNGIVGSGCTLVPTAGTLIPNPGGTTLSSSTGTGAVSGSVAIICTGASSVSVAQPVPLALTPTPAGMELASTLQLGPNSTTGLLGTSVPIAALTASTATVNMTATLTGGLPQGVYNYSVTVTATTP